MAINRVLPLLLLAFSPALWAREAASPAACAAAGSRPDIRAATDTLTADAGNLKNAYQLADLWSDAGCFSKALEVLQTAKTQHPGSQELDTRLRVATSEVGEEHFFDKIDRTDAQAALNRNEFRCANVGDLDACVEAIRMRPDDPKLLIAQGDALVKAGRPDESISRYDRAAMLDPDLASAAEKGKRDARAANPRLALISKTTVATAVPAKVLAMARSAKRTGSTALTPASPEVSPSVSRHYSNEATGDQSH